jgi:hypothetical protein
MAAAGKEHHMGRVRLAVAASVVAGMMAPAAGAQDCSPAGYCGPAGEAQAGAGIREAGQPSGQLPFTGLDIGLFAAGGGMLLLGGAALYRVGRKKA